MKLFNSETNQIETFPPNGNQITVYQCGPAPHEPAHLGHAFTYSTADTLIRYLETKGFSVRNEYVIMNDEEETDQTPSAAGDRPPLGNQWTRQFTEDIQSLHVRPPERFWRAGGVPTAVSSRALFFIDPAWAASWPRSTHSERPAADFLLRAGMVVHEGKTEAQSSTNPVTVRDLLQHYSPDAIRIYLAQQHYRSNWSYDDVALKKAARRAMKLKAAMSAISSGSQSINITPVQNRFTAAMDNDLDTIKGIATLLNLADEIVFRASNGYDIHEAQTALQHMAIVFGLPLTRERAREEIITG